MLDIRVRVGKFLSLSFNSLKSQCISVGHNRIYKQVMLDDSALQRANKMKYLGVTINSFRPLNSLCV